MNTLNQMMLLDVVRTAQNAKMISTVTKLADSIKDQKKHFDSINQSLAQSAQVANQQLQVQNSQLHEQKTQTKILERQTMLMENELKKKLITEAVKDTVFQLRLQIKNINSLKSNIEKFVLCKQYLEMFSSMNINFEDLPDLQDKEYLLNCFEELESISSNAANSFTDEEIADFQFLNDINKKVDSIEAIKKSGFDVVDEIQKILETPSHSIAKLVGDPRITPKHIISPFALMILASFCFLVNLVGISSNNTSMLVAAILFFLITLACFAYYFYDFYKHKAERDASRKRIDDAIASKRKELIDNAKVNFSINFTNMFNEIDKTVSYDNFASVLNEYICIINKKYDSVISRYPVLTKTINFNLLSNDDLVRRISKLNDDYSNVISRKIEKNAQNSWAMPLLASCFIVIVCTTYIIRFSNSNISDKGSMNNNSDLQLQSSKQHSAVEPKPVAQEQAAVEPKPVAQEQAAVEPKPVAQKQAAVEPKPVVQEQAAVEPKPVVKESAATQRPSVMKNNFSPSFDCSKASSSQEKLICSDEELASLDVELADLYKECLKRVYDKGALKESQRSWLKYRGECKDKECIAGSYNERIIELSEELSGI